MNKSILKEILRNRVEWSLEADFDDLPVRGNCMASGDDDFDRECENKIINELNNGNVWAWASVKVSAKFKGFKGVDYLGGCSYKDENDFKQDGYYTDMRDLALDDLVNQILEAKDTLDSILK